MKQIVKLFLILFLFVGQAHSQDDEQIREWFIDAEYYFLYENFDKAIPLYTKIHEKDPTNSNINYRLGLCYLHLPNEKGNKTRSIPYLERASKDITKKYNEGSHKERKAPDEALFYLGNAYRYAHNFEKAIETYRNFLEYLDVGDIYYIEFVEREIQACYNAEELLRLPINLEAESFSEKINSVATIENCPVVSADESTMVFTRGESNTFSPDIALGVINYDYKMDNIFFSQKIDDKWSEPINISKDVNATKKTAPVTISADGKFLYLVSDDNDDGNIYVSEYKKGKWTAMKKLNKNINTKNWESHASLTKDGKTLYFTSDRPGGYGGLDVYRSDLDASGDWGPPVNLGPTINTPYDEETPFILDDGKTLYFSSQGHYSMGGFDIFHSTMIGDNQWSTPLNIGYPINTVGNDLFYLPRANGEYAFFPLNNNDRENIGNNDIYRIKVNTPENATTEILLKGRVDTEDKRAELPQDVKICIVDSITSDTINVLKPDLFSGKYNTIVSSGNFKIIYRATGYKTHEERLFIPKIYTRTEIVLNVNLVPIEVHRGEYIVIKNLFFDYGKFDLRRESQVELEKLYKLMDENPSIYVEIIGHTDSRSSVDFNLKLSKKRARSAIEYLVNKGIDSKRFVEKAMGKSQPVAINENPDGTDNPEGRSLNRRVEIKLLNATSDLVIVEEIPVPDNLRIRGKRDIKYTIQIMETPTKLETAYFSSEYLMSKDTDKLLKKLEIKIVPKGFLYIIGLYNDKSQALADLNKCVDMGFSDSKIVSIDDIVSMEKENDKIKQRQIEESSYDLNNDIYTIQIRALSKPIDLSEFANLKNVKTYIGSDGYYRYTVGEYIGYNRAKADISKIIELGYPDAFVVNVKKYIKKN
ncbi:MAG: PD40 domain-containing protein [Bacteroidales bacterium]|nr:PD40 domain-containing protein [Bacteroidales bacterium]